MLPKNPASSVSQSELRPFDTPYSPCSPTSSYTVQPGDAFSIGWYFPQILDGANGQPYMGDITWENGSTFTVPITGGVTFTPAQTPNDGMTTTSQGFTVSPTASVNLYYTSATGVLGDGTQEGTGAAGVLVYYPVVDTANTSTTYVRVAPGGAATYTFSDATSGADGPLEWVVWSAIPQNSTSAWKYATTNPPYNNTLTIQTSATTPLGETAIGVLVQYGSPICRQNGNGYSADVLIDVETPSPSPSPSPTPSATPSAPPSSNPSPNPSGSCGGTFIKRASGPRPLETGACGSPPPSSAPSPTQSPIVTTTADAVLETTQYPTSAPAYVFEDQQVAAGPSNPSIAALPAVRPYANVVIPCTKGHVTINVKTAGTVKISDSIVCPPESIIDQATAVLQIYSIAAQNTQIGTPQTATQICGTNKCNASFSFSTTQTGLYDLSATYTAHFPGQPPVGSNPVGFVVPYNQKGVAYPQHQDTRSTATGILLFPEPPPAIQGCPQNGSTQPAGCSSRSSSPDGTNFATNLKQLYIANGWPQTVFSSTKPQAHHVQPLCWGGANSSGYVSGSAQNGVYLAASDHQDYTTWWTGVSLNSSTESCSDTD